MRALWLACCAALLTSVVAHAEAPAEVTGTVADVVVRGTRWVEEAAVLARIGLSPGQEITPQKIRRDLKSVYGTGLFRDVDVLVEEVRDGRYRVIFAVTEKPAVVDVRIEGNKKIQEEDIRELIQTKSFGVLNEAKVRETVEQIRAKYVEKGFYLAEVEPEIKEVDANRVEVIFHVTENRRVIVQRVDFVGNDNVADKKIRRFLQTKEGGPVPWLMPSRGVFDKDVLAIDQQIVQQVYLEEGYIEAIVDPPKVYLSPDKRYIYVSFHVDEGRRFAIGDISVAGDFVEEEGLTEEVVRQVIDGRMVVDIQEEQWRAFKGRPRRKAYKPNPSRKAASLEEGDFYKQTTVQQVSGAIKQLYGDRGYAFANVIPQPVPRKDEAIVDMRFFTEKDEKQRIGRIHISGNTSTFDKVIRRELMFNEGELYRGSLIDASRQRLMRLGFFEDVQIATPPGEGEDVLDVNVRVTEQPTGSFSLGVGFGTAEGFSINGSIQRNNFFGLGYLVNAQVQWSQRQRNINLLFSDPYFADARWTFTVSGFWIERDVLDLPEYRRGATVAFGKYLDRRDDIQVQLRYSLVDVGLRSLEATRTRLYGGELFANGLTSTIGLSFIADKRNNRIFPTKGIYATADLSLSGGFRVGDDVVSILGGDFNFVEFKGNVRWYQPLIPKSDWLVLRVNSTIGFLWSTDGGIIPITHRYGAGGINSVRGFPWFSLGPRVRAPASDDPTDGDQSIVIRGTQTWVNNIELEAPIVRAAGISAVVFFDAGNAFGDAYGNGGIDFLDMRTSAGFGVRWRSPIGPLRFEWGFPLNPREDERDNLFDFSIGSFF